MSPSGNTKKSGRTALPGEHLSSASPLLYIVITLLVAGSFFCTGKYIEFGTPGAFDSGAYVYSAEHVLRGAQIGVDENPSARTGTLLVNMLGVSLFGFSETGPLIIQMLMQAFAFVFMYITLRRLFGNLAACVGTIIAVMYLSAPLIAKFGNVKEQYMIAVMIIGTCCYVQRQLGGKWWWSFLAGAVLVWAPCFKQTGVSAIAAALLFTLLLPLFKNRTFRQTISDFGLLAAGAALSMAPACIWLFLRHDGAHLPYRWLWDMLPLHGSTDPGGSYIADAHKVSDFSEQFARVMRYYGFLILPVSLAVISIFTGLIRITMHTMDRTKIIFKPYEKFLPYFAIWWLLDMAFVWISPRSYEQYYLPLNASAAMLSGYLYALYSDALNRTGNRKAWVTGGVVGVLAMILLSFHMTAGIKTSPYSGEDYPERRKGYIQKIHQVRNRETSGHLPAWERTAAYIQKNSDKTDTIFVWGWYPGIYTCARRLSPTDKAFTSEMHVKSPRELELYVNDLVSDLKKSPPLFIVDPRKMHYPWDRPPLSLWPVTKKGLLSSNSGTVARYDKIYTDMLEKRIGEKEALRYRAIKPLRDFVMNHYRPVKQFGNQLVFELDKH